MTMLLRASLEGGVLALVVLAITRWVALPASFKAALWWLACLKLLVGLFGVPLRVGVLPEPVEEEAPIAVISTPAPITFHHHSAPAPALPVPALPDPLPTLWLAGVLLSLVRLAGQLHQTRALVRASTPAPELEPLLASVADELGLSPRNRPALRLAPAATPQLVGLWRPVVILPTGLTPAELRMALGHELTHLRRRDLWLGWIPAAAERIFFFHPLARLAAREYALCREAACDEAVLALAGTAPRDYGRLLVRFGIERRPFAAVLSMGSSVDSLKRRLQMLGSGSSKVMFGRLKSLLVVGVIGLIPLTVGAREKPKKSTLCEVVVGEGAEQRRIPCSPEVRALVTGEVMAPPRPPRPPAPPAAPAFEEEEDTASPRETADLDACLHEVEQNLSCLDGMGLPGNVRGQLKDAVKQIKQVARMPMARGPLLQGCQEMKKSFAELCEQHN